MIVHKKEQISFVEFTFLLLYSNFYKSTSSTNTLKFSFYDSIKNKVM